MAIIKKTDNLNVGKNVKKLEPSYQLVGNNSSTVTTLETSLAVSSYINQMTQQLHSTQEALKHICTTTYQRMFIATLFIIAKN